MLEKTDEKMNLMIKVNLEPFLLPVKNIHIGIALVTKHTKSFS